MDLGDEQQCPGRSGVPSHQRDGPTRAITVTKNVIYGYNDTINVGVWDTGRYYKAFTVAAFDMRAVLADPLNPLPWRICGRLTAHTLTFKIWLPTKEHEPTWNDPVHSRTTDSIPAAYLASGKTGWYIGHIPPAGQVQYNELSIWSWG